MGTSVNQGGIETHPAIPGIARELGERILAEGHTLPIITRLGEQSAELAASMIATAAAHESVVCRAGCSWCCYPPYVTTNAAEVTRIAAYLREALGPAELGTLIEQLRNRTTRIQAMNKEERAHAVLPCALLVDNCCSVHPVRPLACRGWVSSDVIACEASYESGWEHPVPNGRRHLGVTAGIRLGMRQALEAGGLEHEPIDLTAGLLIALSQPDSTDRWLAGEPVFAPARI